MAPHPLFQHGALLLDDNTTRFALWAPDASAVELLLPNTSPQPMQREADGWFVLDAACGAGATYRYRIDGEQEVPDPASRAQQDGVHGHSLVDDPAAFVWQHDDWRGRPWHEAVIQEVHVGAAGGYAALIEQLPRLAELGFTAIELMPLAEFPGERNWGYDGVLPYAPSGAYGSPDELRALIDAAHGLGLMVLLDVVYNHFGPDGNYLGSYASAFFRHDLQTPWGDAIDFRQRPVRDFFIGNALMWLRDYRFDGLRLDAVHAISERDFLVELAARVRSELEPARHVHLVLENEDNCAALLEQGFDAQWNDDGHNVLHVLLSGEQEGYYADFNDAPIEKLARCLGEGFIYQGESNRHGESRGEPSAHLPTTAFVLFLQNHDQIGNRAFGERLISLAEPEALQAATALLLLSPMVPLLFMGEEWGARSPFLFFTDHHDELARAVCEGRRNEFADFAVFADAENRARIPDPNAPETFRASRIDPGERLEPGHREWLDLHRSLLRLRHAEIIPRLPGTRPLGAEVLSERALVARWRLGDGTVLRIELNLGAEALPVAASEPARLLFDSARQDGPAAPLLLPGHCARVYLSESVLTESVPSESS